MANSNGRRWLLSLVWALVYLGLGMLVGLGVSRWYDLALQDALTIVGLVVVVVGVMMSMRGNPSGANIQGMGTSMPQYTANANVDITNVEREITDYRKNFRKQSVVQFAANNLTLILGGILIVLSGLLFG
jgi:hypothetical protein